MYSLAIEVAVGVTNPSAVSAKREIRGGRFHANDRLTAWSQRKSLCVCARKIRLSIRKTKTRSAGSSVTNCCLIRDPRIFRVSRFLRNIYTSEETAEKSLLGSLKQSVPRVTDSCLRDRAKLLTKASCYSKILLYASNNNAKQHAAYISYRLRKKSN